MSTTSRIRLTDRSFRPVLAGATVAVAGFGALFVFWIVGDWRSDVPGLFFYRSATIGDGLLLPLVVGVLYATVCDDELASPAHERGVGLAAAAVGAIAGGTTQAVWLTDPSPAENWSFPRAHHFNSAGWYHAVFLTSAGALLCLLTVSAARRIRTARLQGSPRIRILARSRWIAVLFGASVSLVGLI